MATASTAQLTVTRQELRRRVASRFGDYLLLTATADSADTTHLTDTLNINTGAEHFNGRVLWFADGDNAGAQARVTATDDTTGKLTFAPAVGTIPATGDTVESYNRRGTGFLPAQIHDAINNAIDDAFPLGMIEATQTLSGSFSADSPSMTITASLYDIYRVEFQDTDSYWHVIPPASGTNEWGWKPFPGGTIDILGWPAEMADTYTIRVTGYGRQDRLSTDTDTCALSPEWLVVRAAYHLALGAMMRSTEFGPLASQLDKESQKLKTRIRTLRRPGSQRVRST